MASSNGIYTFVGTSSPSNQTGAVQISSGTVNLGQSGYFTAADVQAVQANGIVLVPGPASSPISGITAPTVAGTTGASLSGTYRYVVTFVTAAGETIPGPEAGITLSSQAAALSNIPIGSLLSGVTARRIYRTKANGAANTEFYVATISDNTTTTYTDTTADSSLSAALPSSDTSFANIAGMSSLAEFECLTPSARTEAIALIQQTAGSSSGGGGSGGGGGIPGVTVLGTPSTGNVLTASSPFAAGWQAPTTPLNPVAAVTISGALAVGQHNPCNATGGALTMTLPTGASLGTLISVEKEDSSVNTVTITGNVRGVGSSSMSLKLPDEAQAFVADSSGSWWPWAGHKTLASLDARYSPVNGMMTVALGNLTGNVTIDLSKGSWFQGVLTGNVTITLINWYASASQPTLDLLQDGVGGHTITFVNVYWQPTGNPPNFLTGIAQQNLIQLWSDDAGAHIFGDSYAGSDSGLTLAAVSWAPSTNPAVAATGTMAAISSANLAATFTVPASGTVLVRLSGQANVSASSPYYWGLLNSVGGQVAPAEFMNGGAYNGRLCADFLVSGLTPLLSTTLTPAHSSTGTASFNCSANAVSTPALISHVSAQFVAAAGPVTTAGITTTGATLLVASVSWAVFSDTAVVTDSHGNTWTKLTGYEDTGTTESQLFYCANPVVGAGHTFTLTGSGGNIYGSIAVAAFSGTSPALDVHTGAVSASTTTIQAGSITPTNNNELIIAGLTWGFAGTAATIDSGFTILEQLYASGPHEPVALAYLIQTTAAAVNPTWTGSFSTTTEAASIAAFGFSSPGGGAAVMTVTGV